MLILDNLENPGRYIQGNEWEFFTDGVMGGLSCWKVNIEEVKNKKCYWMTGNVTTENNGGYIQIRLVIDTSIASENFSGIYFNVHGNNKIHNPFTHTFQSYAMAVL